MNMWLEEWLAWLVVGFALLGGLILLVFYIDPGADDEPEPPPAPLDEFERWDR